MFDEIYVVMGSCGEYSDHTEWPIAAYADESIAKQHVEAASAAYRELLQRVESADGSRYSLGRPPYQNVYDKDMQTDYTGTDYYYITVPFKTALEAPPFAEAPL
jgi:hypothetical protein